MQEEESPLATPAVLPDTLISNDGSTLAIANSIPIRPGPVLSAQSYQQLHVSIPCFDKNLKLETVTSEKSKDRYHHRHGAGPASGEAAAIAVTKEEDASLLRCYPFFLILDN